MPHQAPRSPERLFTRPSWAETQVVLSALRTETVGGGILLGAAVVALLWANSPWRDAYSSLRDATFGYQPWQLNLSLAAWASDGLLAIFFFVVGLELKREFLIGSLSDRRKAAIPVIAAACGVATPAMLYAATVLALGDAGALRGWAIPTATDIAFALAVLAVLGTFLPAGLRSFLLTLAVVDDLIAITIIAIFLTDGLQIVPLAAALVPLAAFGLLVQRRIIWIWVLVPLAAATWILVHASGVHATVAGVLLSLTVPVRPRRSGPTDDSDLAERFEHTLRPLSAGFAVPVFAFFAAGVTVVGGGFAAALRDPAAAGIVVGLVAGKVIGVFGSTWILANLTRAQLDEDLAWIDVFGLALITGIGFTVALLVGELSFGADPQRDANVRLGIICASTVAAAGGAVVLRRRNATYRRIYEADQVDDDHDGIPDAFQR